MAVTPFPLTVFLADWLGTQVTSGEGVMALAFDRRWLPLSLGCVPEGIFEVQELSLTPETPEHVASSPGYPSYVSRIEFGEKSFEDHAVQCLTNQTTILES